MLDELARYNKERWEELATAGIQYSRPFLDLDETKARQIVDSQALLGDLRGKDALCLASGGGQQSAAFALLGANVTVLDLSETQLERDQEAARHYGHAITTFHGDMRDLSVLGGRSFDVVWHAHSINFVPTTQPVFDGVARILRSGGYYHLSFHNPFTHGMDDVKWNGVGYLMSEPYIDGAEIDHDRLFEVPEWTFENEYGAQHRIRGPREFRHTLSNILNGLTRRGFVLQRFGEETTDSVNPAPGSWEHYLSVVAPYMWLWAKLQSE